MAKPDPAFFVWEKGDTNDEKKGGGVTNSGNFCVVSSFLCLALDEKRGPYLLFSHHECVASAALPHSVEAVDSTLVFFFCS